MNRAVFLDRDGVINVDVAYCGHAKDFTLIDGVLQAARTYCDAGYLLVVVTNQSGIARGYYTEEDFSVLSSYMKDLFAKAHAPIAGVYFCPHHPDAKLSQYRQNCSCRKPAPGMILQAANDLHIDLTQSILFGDKRSDMQAAYAAGIPTRVLLGTDGLRLPEHVTEATAISRSLLTATQEKIGL